MWKKFIDVYQEDISRMAIKKRIIDTLKKHIYNVNVQYEEWLKLEALNINEPYIDGRNYSSNIERQSRFTADISRRKDIVIENILNKRRYTFDNALFIINPFKYSPLSGLLIFNTETPCKVRYTIKGIRGSKDYTNCDETLTDKHQVPILGMYDGTINIIRYSLLDKNGNEINSHTIRIKLPRTGPLLRNCISISKYKPASAPFIMATGGYSGVDYAFDSHGNIRWYLTMPVHPYGVHILSNGHMLVPDKRMRRPNYGNAHSVFAYEMDFLGRIHRNIFHQSGFHHWAISKENDENMLIATSSRYDTYMENSIDEIDKTTGESIRFLNTNKLFDSTYITRYDWAHVNSFEYIPEEDAIIASYRNIHTIAKIDLKTNELVWILANPAFYENTAQADKVLKPYADIKWFFQQHGVKILERINTDNVKKIRIALFDNHTANRRPVDYFDDVEKSNIMVFTIDETNMTAKMDKFIPVPLSITRSNVEFDKENNCIYAMCANIKDEEIDSRAKIMGFDYDTNECITDISCTNDYFIAKFIDFNLENIKSTFEEDIPVCSGKLYEPVLSDALPENFNTEKYLTDEFKKDLHFSLYGSLIQIVCKDHSVLKVFLYNDSYAYTQCFDDTKQLTKVFKDHIYTILVPLNSLERGKYQIGVEYHHSDEEDDIKNGLFNTRYWVEIK